MKRIIKAITSSVIVVCLAASTMIPSTAETIAPIYDDSWLNGVNYNIKYCAGWDASTVINMNVDGYTQISKSTISSADKFISTYACICSGGTKTTSLFKDTVFAKPSTGPVNNGRIVVGVSANYYSTGATAIPSYSTYTTTNHQIETPRQHINTSSKITAYGTIEYQNNTDTIYEYLGIANY